MGAAQQIDLFRGNRADHAVKPDAKDWSREASAFFAKHPEAIELFCTIALEDAEGREYLSAKKVWEEVRLLLGPKGIRCNNNFTKTAAEIARTRHPELARKMRARGRR